MTKKKTPLVYKNITPSKEFKKGGFARKAADIGMFAADSTIGVPLSMVTGRSFSDTVGYNQKTRMGRKINKVSDTRASILGKTAKAAAGVVGTVVAGPAGGAVASQAMGALQETAGKALVDGSDNASLAHTDGSMLNEGQLDTVGQVADLGSMAFGAHNKVMAMGGPIENSASEGGAENSPNSSMEMINSGGRHEDNVNGGVPIGNDQTIEEGEMLWESPEGKKFVFTNRLNPNKTLLNEFNIGSKKSRGRYAKMTFAELAEDLKKKSSEDGGENIDQFGKETIKTSLKNLSEAQEAFKQVEAQKAAEQYELMTGSVLPDAQGNNGQFAGGGWVDSGIPLGDMLKIAKEVGIDLPSNTSSLTSEMVETALEQAGYSSPEHYTAVQNGTSQTREHIMPMEKRGISSVPVEGTGTPNERLQTEGGVDGPVGAEVAGSGNMGNALRMASVVGEGIEWARNKKLANNLELINPEDFDLDSNYDVEDITNKEQLSEITGRYGAVRNSIQSNAPTSSALIAGTLAANLGEGREKAVSNERTNNTNIQIRSGNKRRLLHKDSINSNVDFRVKDMNDKNKAAAFNNTSMSPMFDKLGMIGKDMLDEERADNATDYNTKGNYKE